MIKRLMLIAALTTGAVASYAEESPRPGRDDKRVLFINYDADQVVKIRGRARASTQIVFAVTEEIANVAIGDTIAWEVAPAQNILFLKPRELHPPTNLQVVTVRATGERRNYNFELVSSAEGQVYYTVKFRYPIDEANARQERAEQALRAKEAGTIDDTLSLHQSYGKRNFEYSAQGSRALQPDAVYDDGKVTVMRFAGNRPVPAIYMIRDDGTESLVPNDVRDSGRAVVLHGLARQFVLRSGKDVLCVYNERFDPVGVNPATGTTSPSISRELAQDGRGNIR